MYLGRTVRHGTESLVRRKGETPGLSYAMIVLRLPDSVPLTVFGQCKHGHGILDGSSSNAILPDEEELADGI